MRESVCIIKVKMITFGLFSNYKADIKHKICDVSQAKQLGNVKAFSCSITIFSSNFVRMPERPSVANVSVNSKPDQIPGEFF